MATKSKESEPSQAEAAGWVTFRTPQGTTALVDPSTVTAIEGQANNASLLHMAGGGRLAIEGTPESASAALSE